MTPHQQKIQGLLDSLTCELRKQYFYRLIAKDKPTVITETQSMPQVEDKPDLAEPNPGQDYPLMIVPIEHSEHYDIVSGVFLPENVSFDLSSPLRTAGNRICIHAPRLETSADLAELFREPENVEYFRGHGMKLLMDSYTDYGSIHSDIEPQTVLKATHGNCLVQLLNGEIVLRHSKEIHGSKDITAILAFPSDITSFCEYTAHYVPVDDLRECGQLHTMEIIGMFSNLPNLTYVTSIPEGVTDLQFAFQGCPKLNCNIHVPSTATRIFGMLNECDAFSSKIFMHGAQRDVPGFSSLPVQATWLTEV